MSDLNDAALALSSLAASAVDSYSSYKYSKRLMDYQLEKNKEQFQYQSGLQRDYQRFLWQNQGASEVESLKSAGLNPAGVNSSIGGASVPSLAAGGSAPSFGRQNSAQTALQALAVSKEMKKTDAEIAVLNSEAYKNTSEADLTSKQVDTFEDSLAVSLGLQRSQTGYYSAEQQKALAELPKIQQETDYYASLIKNTDADTALKKVQEKDVLKSVEERDARIKLLNAQEKAELIKASAAMIAAKASVMQASAAQTSAGAAVTSAGAAVTSARGSYVANMANAHYLDAQKDYQDVLTKLKNKYGDAEMIVGLGTSVISSVGSVMTGIGAVGMAGSALKRAGQTINVQYPSIQTSTPIDPRAFKGIAY